MLYPSSTRCSSVRFDILGPFSMLSNSNVYVTSLSGGTSPSSSSSLLKYHQIIHDMISWHNFT